MVVYGPAVHAKARGHLYAATNSTYSDDLGGASVKWCALETS